MKTVKKYLALPLCFTLCLCLAPAALADGRALTVEDNYADFPDLDWHGEDAYTWENMDWMLPDGELAVEDSPTFNAEPAYRAESTAQFGAALIAIDDVHFPDPVFLDLVKSFDTDRDGALSEAERSAVTRIDCSNSGVSSLLGVEYFPALRELDCFQNPLTSLDISRNLELTELNCHQCSLTELDVSRNTNLQYLICASNQLSTLDLSKNAALYWINCGSNPLGTLDVSKNPLLYWISCYNDQLTSLDLSNNTALGGLYCFANTLTSLDVSRNPELQTLSCYQCGLVELNLRNNPSLQTLYCYQNPLPQLDVSHDPELTLLNCHGCELTALDLSGNAKLEQLICASNKLTSLDLSRNPALDWINCGSNPLGTLDVSKNPQLIWISCYRDQLTSLDLSNNPALEGLYCFTNQLTELDLRGNPNLVILNCQYNPLTDLDLSACPELLRIVSEGTKEESEGIVRYAVDDNFVDNKYGNSVQKDLICNDTVRLIPFAAPDADCVLPADLQRIEQEAFLRCAFRCVRLNEQVTSIGNRTFADSASLRYIYIPASVTNIGSTAFDGVDNLTIFGASGSKAQTFAAEHGFAFIALS